MDVELHLARVQQRWRNADDELEPGQILHIEQLAHDFSTLPDHLSVTADAMAESALNLLGTDLANTATPGGSIEPEADDDGVLIEPAPIREQTLP
jgi:type IV secretion system protein VirD4